MPSADGGGLAGERAPLAESVVVEDDLVEQAESVVSLAGRDASEPEGLRAGRRPSVLSGLAALVLIAVVVIVVGGGQSGMLRPLVLAIWRPRLLSHPEFQGFAFTGCSNWDRIVVGSARRDSADECAAACNVHPMGCSTFNYATSGSGAGMCFLFSGECDQEFNQDWELYSVHSPLRVSTDMGHGKQMMGCSNWEAILLSRGREDSAEQCAEACRREPDCTSANYGISGEDAGKCCLFSGDCDQEFAENWDFYAVEPSLSVVQDFQEQSEKPGRCMVTCTSEDGIGHQMESKLVCLGTAFALGMQYVHIPMYTAEHDSDPHWFEDFFGLGLFGKPFLDFKGMQRTERPKVLSGHSCSNLDPQEWCPSDGFSVSHADNCNDRFFCPAVMALWPSVVPAIQHAYYSTPKPDLQWFDGLAHTNWGSKVVVHFRRGDTFFPVSTDYYIRTISRLRQELLEADGAPPLFRVETDATKADLLMEAPALQADDVVIDDIHTPLDIVIHFMVTADVLVVSASSLSVTAALIGNNHRVLAPCLVGRTVPINATILHWEKEQLDCPLED